MALPLSRMGATDPSNLNGDGGVCVRVPVCTCMCACVCVRACNDNNYYIIILYFIQIRHTDDFPSMGTRLVHLKMTDI